MVRRVPLVMSVTAMGSPATVNVPTATANYLGFAPIKEAGGGQHVKDTLSVYLGGTNWTDNPLVAGNPTDTQPERYADWTDYLNRETPFAGNGFIGALDWDTYAARAKTRSIPIQGKRYDYSAPVTSTDDPSWVGFPFEEVNSGARDQIWVDLANSFINDNGADAIIRISHEPDLNFAAQIHRDNRPDDYWWQSGDPETATIKYDEFKKAWNRVAQIMSSQPGANFDFHYSVNGPALSQRTDVNGDWLFEAGFPGTQYCTAAGPDVYFNGVDPAEEVADMQRIADFCVNNNVKFAIGEWGVRSTSAPDDPIYADTMFDFLSTLPASGPGALFYHSYFNGNSQAALQSNPNFSARFKELFGDPD